MSRRIHLFKPHTNPLILGEGTFLDFHPAEFIPLSGAGQANAQNNRYYAK